VARRLRSAVGLPERDGLLVRAVEEGSPAERAGVRVGDLIATAGGREVRDADELHEVLDSLGEAGTLQLALVRGTDELTVIVAFGSGSEQVGSV
jgi:serine protease Do